MFESLAADDRALRGTVTGLEQTFAGLADAHEPLAESLQILPTFEREADLTLERLDRLGEKARPVVAKLLPVANDVPPTLASVRRLAPDLESALRQTEPLIKAAEKGLPALTGTLEELGPVFDALDPFLAELNPVVAFLSAYRERVATFFSNPHIGLAGSLPEIPNQPAPRHALRVLFHFSAESFSIHRTRLATNRGNAYQRPNGYTEGLEELYIPAFDCKNTDYTPESQDPDENERFATVENETFHSDGQQPEIGYDYSSCGIANPFTNFGGGRAPQLFADPRPLCAERQHRRRNLARGGIGDRRRGPFEHDKPRTGNLARERFAVADREERIAATVQHQGRDRKLGQALAPARLAIELREHHAHLVGHLDGGFRARRPVPDARGGRARGGGVVAQDLRAAGDILRHRGAVGPVGRRSARTAAHRRLVMVRQVVVERPGATGRVPASVSAENASG